MGTQNQGGNADQPGSNDTNQKGRQQSQGGSQPNQKNDQQQGGSSPKPGQQSQGTERDRSGSQSDSDK